MEMTVEGLAAVGSSREGNRMHFFLSLDIELHNKGCQQILGKVEQLRHKEKKER